jgi:hypothetical protein
MLAHEAPLRHHRRMMSRFAPVAALVLAACAGTPAPEQAETPAPRPTTATCQVRWDSRSTHDFQIITIADSRRFIADYNRLLDESVRADRAFVLRSRQVKRAALVAFVAGECVVRLIYLDQGIMRIIEGNAGA